MSEWKLVKTAPKDGRAVIGFWGNSARAPDPSSYGITRWNGHAWVSADDEEDEWAKPSHWMPLPPPPGTCEDRPVGKDAQRTVKGTQAP